MAYVPDPTDSTNPLDTVDASTAAAEFRALKAWILGTASQTFAAGTAAAPTIRFAGSLTTGFYRNAADEIGVANAGVYKHKFQAAGFTSVGFVAGTALNTSSATPIVMTNSQAVSVALTAQTSGATTLTIPDFAGVVDEFTFKTKSQTLSNKTFVAPALGTVASGVISACTSTSMVMVTPLLGTPTSGVLTSCTGLPLTTGVTGILPTANGGTGIAYFTAAGPTSARIFTFPDAAATIARTDAGQTFTGVQVFTSPDVATSITTSSTTLTAFAGATTLLTIGGTGASSVFAIPGTLEQSSTTGALTVAGGVYIAKKLNVVGIATLGNGAVLGTVASGVISACTSTSMVLTTPILGTPTSGTLTNCTGLPAAGVSGTAAVLNGTQTFTAPQRGTQTTDNDGSFDLNVTNNFKCTTAGSLALTFTNIPTGQSGNILFINASNHTITAGTGTKTTAATLTALSATGTYMVGYYADGTNVYVSATAALS